MSAERNGAADLDALQAERDLYARILELTRKQLELAEGGRTEDLLSLLGDKGRLTEEAARCAATSRDLKANWARRAAEFPPADVERGRRLLGEITALLGEILAGEEACQRALGGRREGTLEELLRVQRGKKVARAYGKKPPQDPRFKDERK